MKDQIYWAIKGPEGEVLAGAIWKKKSICIECFAGEHWSGYYKLGYRCVKIEILELKK